MNSSSDVSQSASSLLRLRTTGNGGQTRLHVLRPLKVSSPLTIPGLKCPTGECRNLSLYTNDTILSSVPTGEQSRCNQRQRVNHSAETSRQAIKQSNTQVARLSINLTVGRLVGQASVQPDSQSISHPIGDSVSQCQRIIQTFSQAENEPTNQSINDSINQQSMKSPTNQRRQSCNHSGNHSVRPSIDPRQAAQRTMNWLIENTQVAISNQTS